MRILWELRTEVNSRHYVPISFLLVTVLWSFFNSAVLHYHPPVGAYMACLALGAAAVTIWPAQSRWAKVAWIIVFLLITVFEIGNLPVGRLRHPDRTKRTGTTAPIL